MIGRGGGRTTILTGTLTLVVTLQSILITASKDATTGQYPYSHNTSVFLSEVFKCLLALTLLQRARSNAPPDEPIVMRGIGRHSLRYAVPSVFYAIQNNLVFVALELLPAPTFQLLQNLKIITTAVVFRLFLKRQLRVVQWVSILLLALGMAVASLKDLNDEGHTSLLGVVCMVAISLLSGCAGVYNESLLKGDPDDIHWINAQSYMFSSLTCVVFARFSMFGPGMFDGFTFLPSVIVLLNAFLGQIVAQILKYANSVIKTYAASAAILLVSLLSILFFDFEPSVNLFLGVAIALVAFFLYFSDHQRLLLEDGRYFAGHSGGGAAYELVPGQGK